MICFEVLELKQLFKNDSIEKMKMAMEEMGYGYQDIHFDEEKRNEVADYVVGNKLKNKEDIEIFSALTSAVEFFEDNCKICFPLKDSYNAENNYIKTIEDLKKSTKEDSLADFAIYKEGLRVFQLKQYRGELDTNHLFDFIKKKVVGYGNNLGDVNLLIKLQGRLGGKLSKNGQIKITPSNIDYHELHKKIKNLNYNFKGEILINYNELNKVNVLNQVYPELKTTRREIDQDYFAGKILYN